MLVEIAGIDQFWPNTLKIKYPRPLKHTTNDNLVQIFPIIITSVIFVLNLFTYPEAKTFQAVLVEMQMQ